VADKGSITQMDVQIGRLRTMLASKGVAQNTMLWFSSDKWVLPPWEIVCSACVLAVTRCVHSGPAARQISTQGLRQCKGSLWEGCTLPFMWNSRMIWLKFTYAAAVLVMRFSWWKGGVREPGLIEWPAMIGRNVKTGAIAGTWDFMPTVLDILRLPPHPPAPTTDWPTGRSTGSRWCRSSSYSLLPPALNRVHRRHGIGQPLSGSARTG
jgi:arylsulfatase A-like enzyme